MHACVCTRHVCVCMHACACMRVRVGETIFLELVLSFHHVLLNSNYGCMCLVTRFIDPPYLF